MRPLHAALTLAFALAPHWASGDALILNEYNAVKERKFLDGGNATEDLHEGAKMDQVLGRVSGNGGDWFELVIVQEGLDLRGFRLQMIDAKQPKPLELVFSDHPAWQSLRAGTLLTIAEKQPTDMSYDPANGDWWINVQSRAGGDATYITQRDFEVSQNQWQLSVRDARGQLVYGPVGEGISPIKGIGSDEVFRLHADPSPLISPSAPCYGDGTHSTFGRPNRWKKGALEQNFDALRAGLPAPPECGRVLSELAFAPDRLLEIDIQMLPDDLEAMRNQARDLMDDYGGDCNSQPPSKPFTYFTATASIDGEVLADIGVRKKGYWGSGDVAKPALRLSFDHGKKGQRWNSLSRMVLNNSKNDPSYINQCVGYGLFRKAGLPAPRCSFAHVRLNGETSALTCTSKPYAMHSWFDTSVALKTVSTKLPPATSAPS